MALSYGRAGRLTAPKRRSLSPRQVQAGASASLARTALVTEGAQAGMLHVDAGGGATVEARDGEKRT